MADEVAVKHPNAVFANGEVLSVQYEKAVL